MSDSPQQSSKREELLGKIEAKRYAYLVAYLDIWDKLEPSMAHNYEADRKLCDLNQAFDDQLAALIDQYTNTRVAEAEQRRVIEHLDDFIGGKDDDVIVFTSDGFAADKDDINRNDPTYSAIHTELVDVSNWVKAGGKLELHHIDSSAGRIFRAMRQEQRRKLATLTAQLTKAKEEQGEA